MAAGNREVVFLIKQYFALEIVYEAVVVFYIYCYINLPMDITN